MIKKWFQRECRPHNIIIPFKIDLEIAFIFYARAFHVYYYFMCITADATFTND